MTLGAPSGAEIRDAAPPEWHTIKLIENPVYRYGLLALVAVYLVWSVGALEINWQLNALSLLIDAVDVIRYIAGDRAKKVAV